MHAIGAQIWVKIISKLAFSFSRSFFHKIQIFQFGFRFFIPPFSFKETLKQLYNQILQMKYQKRSIVKRKSKFSFDKSNYFATLKEQAILLFYQRHRRRKCEGSSPNSLRTISYFGSIFRHKNQSFVQEKEPATLSHGEGTHSAKIVLTVWPKIPQMPQNISAQFIRPSPKVSKF